MAAPAPWEWVEGAREVWAADRTLVAEVFELEMGPLITAAPLLLRAAELALSGKADKPLSVRQIMELGDAVRKARGGL